MEPGLAISIPNKNVEHATDDEFAFNSKSRALGIFKQDNFVLTIPAGENGAILTIPHDLKRAPACRIWVQSDVDSAKKVLIPDTRNVTGDANTWLRLWYSDASNLYISIYNSAPGWSDTVDTKFNGYYYIVEDTL